MTDQRFPRDRRLLRRKDFERVFGEGRKTIRPSLVVHAQDTTERQRPTRIGLTVSRKNGKAHDRNRIKRRLRDIFRLMQPSLVTGWDIVVTARPPARDATSDTLRADLLSALSKLGVYSPEEQHEHAAAEATPPTPPPPPS